VVIFDLDSEDSELIGELRRVMREFGNNSYT